MDNGDENIKYYNVYRSLSAPIYRIRFYFIALTEADIIICMLFTLGLMSLLDTAGLNQVKLLGLTLDPWYDWGAGIVLALVISLGHKLRPEGDIQIIIRGLLAPKLLSASAYYVDKYWQPSDKAIK